MNKQEFTDARTGERCVRIDHPSGLTIFVYPKPDYASSYAVFATRYGSIDNVFRIGDDAEETAVPAGIAHYLEHKLFESEDGDAFERYAATGASANAFTSFDRTAYLFTCTGDVRPSLDILLDFVQHPYFTEQTVEKEQGIIGQEIKMCNDSPARCVFLNMLEGLYHTHPVRIDIAGTVASIAEITPELLYGCYRSFYNLHNMVLAVSGRVTVEQVLEIADKRLHPAADWSLARKTYDEPRTALRTRVEQAMPVAAPLFYLGFKDAVAPGEYPDPTREMAADVLLDLIGGRSSALYARLMEQGLINQSFGAEYFTGPGYAVALFGGESRDPDRVAQELYAEIDRLRREGIDPAAFAAARNAQYGQMVAGLNNVEECADMLVDDHLRGNPPFAMLDAAAKLTMEDVQALLRDGWHREASTLSVIVPSDKEEVK